MSLHWYKPPRPTEPDLATHLEHLHPLGVRWEGDWADAPAIQYSVEDGELLAEIGGITVSTKSGLIRVWPYRGIGGREARVLASTAQLAFEQKPTNTGGWSYVRRGVPRWVTYISVAVEDGDPVKKLVMAHHDSIVYEPMKAINRVIEREAAKENAAG